MYRQALLASAFSLLLASAVQVRAGEVARWNVIATDAALAEQLDPLTESRIFAIVHASIHDALNAIERRYQPYQSRISAAPNASPEAAVAGAAHAALVELIPARKAAFDATGFLPGGSVQLHATRSRETLDRVIFASGL